jgi:hypothetical protein
LSKEISPCPLKEINMNRVVSIAPALVIALLAGSHAALAETPCYELVRVSSTQDQSPASRSVVQCDLKPGISSQTSQIGGILSTRDSEFKTDDVAVQALVDSVPGIKRQDENTQSHTSWWVIPHPGDTPKLVRQNLTFTDGRNVIIQDESDAGKMLSALIGINCSQTF